MCLAHSPLTSNLTTQRDHLQELSSQITVEFPPLTVRLNRAVTTKDVKANSENQHRLIVNTCARVRYHIHVTQLDKVS